MRTVAPPPLQNPLLNIFTENAYFTELKLNR